MKKTWVRAIVSIGLTGLFLWLAFRQVDLEVVGRILGGVEALWVAAYFASLFAAQALRVVRWGILVRPLAEIRYLALTRITLIGLLMIFLLPLRLGEFVRPYLLKREVKVPMSAGLATVVVERASDGLLMTVMFFVSTALLGEQYPVPEILDWAAYGALAIFSTATTVIIASAFWREQVATLVRRVGYPVSVSLTDAALGLLDTFIDGLRALPDRSAVLRFFLVTLLDWALLSLGYSMLFAAFGFPLPLIAGLVVNCVVVFGVMIPAGPGSLGPFQAAILLGLSIFGIAADEAAAYGLLMYALILLVNLFTGLPAFLSANVSFSQLLQVRPSAGEDRVPESAPET